jgi:hypothetical protein
VAEKRSAATCGFPLLAALRDKAATVDNALVGHGCPGGRRRYLRRHPERPRRAAAVGAPIDKVTHEKAFTFEKHQGFKSLSLAIPLQKALAMESLSSPAYPRTIGTSLFRRLSIDRRAFSSPSYCLYPRQPVSEGFSPIICPQTHKLVWHDRCHYDLHSRKGQMVFTRTN